MAVAVAIAAFGLTFTFHLQERPFLIPMIGVLFTALRGGLSAGLICAVVSLALANYYIMPPVNEFEVPTLREAYELGVFGLTAAIISALAARGRQSRLTLEATVASIGDGVIVTDPTGRVTFLNSVAEHLTGWSAREAEGAPIAAVFNVVREGTRVPLPNPAERALRERIVVGLADHALLIRRDGSELPVADSGAPIHDHHDRLIGAVLVFRDATPQRRVEETLRRQAEERQRLLENERSARAEAERANRLKDDFLATLSHELRTPLNAVMGWAHMLARRELSDAQQRQALAAIHRNALAQSRLVDDVLDLSRIVTGRMPLAAEPVEITEIVRTTVESFTPAVLAKRQTVQLDLAPRAMITGDAHRLRQVVWNLLSNATKFTPEGGTITVRVRQMESRIEVEVADTGEGIEPSFLPFVFERFRQADSSTTRRHGGLGLGLALVRHLAEAHGGTVSAESEGRDRGATMRVTLPARPPDPAVAAPSAGLPGDLTGRRVLVLDDNEDARVLTGLILRQLGAEARLCASVDEALETLAEQRFDLILADLAIPGRDGFGFLREVRDRGVRTPALALTAYSDDGNRDKALAAGFEGFLPKPITADGLQSALQDLGTATDRV
jgi:PAS domain S-box-containing protein